jgi:hypothetical protein
MHVDNARFMLIEWQNDMKRGFAAFEWLYSNHVSFQMPTH